MVDLRFPNGYRLSLWQVESHKTDDRARLHAGVASGLIEGVDAKGDAAIESICDIVRRSNWAGPFNEVVTAYLARKLAEKVVEWKRS